MKLGEILVKRRTELGLTQEEAAKHIGITRTRLSQIECGKAKKPNIRTIVRIAEFLKKPTTYVVNHL